MRESWKAASAVALIALISTDIGLHLASHAKVEPHGQQHRWGNDIESRQDEASGSQYNTPPAFARTSPERQPEQGNKQVSSEIKQAVRDIATFAQYWSPAIQGLSSAAVALFTVALMVVGGRQINVTRKASREQLRAYVSCFAQEPAPDLEKNRKIIVTFKNHGQTPAYNCTVGVDSVLYRPEMETIKSIMDNVWADILPDRRGMIVLNPGEERVTVREIMPHITAKSLAYYGFLLFVASDARYEDIQGRVHRTRTRQQWRQGSNGAPPAWHYCAGGNDAD